MILSPYQTTACKNYILTKIIAEIRQVLINGGMGISYQWPGVAVITHAAVKVKEFTQPITQVESMAYSNGDNSLYVPPVIIDGRTWLREVRDASSREPSYTIGAHSEGELQIIRAKLQAVWQSEEHNKLDLMRIGDLPAVVMASWISRSLTKQLGLDPSQQLIAEMVVAYYYFCLFYTKAEFTEATALRTIKHASTVTRVRFEPAQESLMQLGFLETIEDLCRALKLALNTSRTENLSPGFLVTLLSTGWFGTNKTELISVSLEHPPTWVAMINSALNDRSYKKSPIGIITLGSVRAGSDKLFNRGMVQQLGPFDNQD